MIIQVTINTYGTVSRKKYPKATYKVGGKYHRGPNGLEIDPLSEAGLLLANGWTVAKPMYGPNYFYMTAPDGQYQKCPVVEIDVPEPNAVKALALALYAGGVEVRGTLQGWPYRYSLRRTKTRTFRVIGLDETTWETETYEHDAHFEIGTSLVWSVYAEWDNGGDVPRWVCHGSSEYRVALLAEAGAEQEQDHDDRTYRL